MKTHPIYESPILERNQQKHSGAEYQCVCCGKPTNGQFGILVSTSWVAVPADTNESDFDSQGWFPVGTECKKHFPKEFIIKT